MEVSLPDEAIAYYVANDLVVKLMEKGKYEEAKVLYLAALEGTRRVLGEEHKDTLATLNDIGAVLLDMKDYEGALDYYYQAMRGKERVVGRMRKTTLMILENIGDESVRGAKCRLHRSNVINVAVLYMEDLKDFARAEESLRRALDGYERSLGKLHIQTFRCVRDLFRLFIERAPSKAKLAALVDEYPEVLDHEWNGLLFQKFIDRESDPICG